MCLLSSITSQAAPNPVSNAEAFRHAAKSAFERMKMGEYRRSHVPGGVGGEAGFTVKLDGTISKLGWHDDRYSDHGNLKLQVSSDDMGLFHTHDYYHQSDPSAIDIAAAKSAHITIWVESRDGLYEISPDGVVTHVFTAENWFSK